MAAIQLLTGHHYWLTRTAFTTPFIRAGRSPLSGQPLAHVRWKAAARALAAGQSALHLQRSRDLADRGRAWPPACRPGSATRSPGWTTPT